VLVNRCLSWGHQCSVRFTRTSSITILFTWRDWDHWPSVSRKCASWPTFIPPFYYMALTSHTCSWGSQRLPPPRPYHECVTTVICEANQWRQRPPKSLPVAGSTHTPNGHPPGFKEAWKGSVTLRLRHRMELCVALTLLSYSWWPEMFIVRSWRCTIACHMFYTCIQFRYRLPLSAVGAPVKQVHDT